MRHQERGCCNYFLDGQFWCCKVYDVRILSVKSSPAIDASNDIIALLSYPEFYENNREWGGYKGIYVGSVKYGIETVKR